MYRYVLATIFFIFAVPYFVSAADSFTDLEVELIYPDNQVLDSESFFDISAEPNQSNSMDVRIHNKSSKPVTINVEKTNAYTAPNGGIIYGTTAVSEDTKLLDGAIRLADYINTEKSITIPAEESADLHVHVTVPEIDKGTLLGGIKLILETQKEEDVTETIAESKTNFENETETTKSIAIRLNLSEKMASNFSLGKAEYDSAAEKIYLETINGANHIQENIEGVYTVMDNSGAVLFKGAIEPFAMAPMSKTKLQITPDYGTLEEGTYILMIKGKSGEKEFFAEEPFTISTDKVLAITENKYSSADTEEYYEVLPSWFWIIGVIIFGVITIFTVKKRKRQTSMLNLK